MFFICSRHDLTRSAPHTNIAVIAASAEAVQNQTELDALVAYLQVMGTALK
jgi:cbb3-type cytochrome oxidase cytochrome c subunit